MRKCEVHVIVKIISHSSSLSDDDPKLKGYTRTHKLCKLCDRYEIEDARHLILHCPLFHKERNEMFNDIESTDYDMYTALNESNRDIVYVILGGALDVLNETQNDQFMLITLNYIYSIYMKNVRTKIGIGENGCTLMHQFNLRYTDRANPTT